MNMQRGVKFAGIGSAVPSQRVTNDDLSKFLDTNDEWISERTGIKARYVCDPAKSEDGLSISVQAIKNIKGELAPERIDTIICATSTPDYLYPSMACRIQAEIGASNAWAFDLSAACSGFVYALSTARALIVSGMASRILLVGVDIHSRFLDWSDRSVSILFGDGAGALIMEACPIEENQYLSEHLKSDGTGGCDLTLPISGTGYPRPKEQIENPTVYMNGRKIYQFAVKTVPTIIEEVCQKAGVSTNDINHLLCHQANQRILDAITSRMGWSDGVCLSNIAKYGNTSAATIPLLWDEYQSEIKSGSLICLAGFGAGLTMGGVLIRV